MHILLYLYAHSLIFIRTFSDIYTYILLYLYAHSLIFIRTFSDIYTHILLYLYAHSPLSTTDTRILSLETANTASLDPSSVTAATLNRAKLDRLTVTHLSCQSIGGGGGDGGGGDGDGVQTDEDRDVTLIPNSDYPTINQTKLRKRKSYSKGFHLFWLKV